MTEATEGRTIQAIRHDIRDLLGERGRRIYNGLAGRQGCTKAYAIEQFDKIAGKMEDLEGTVAKDTERRRESYDQRIEYVKAELASLEEKRDGLDANRDEILGQLQDAKPQIEQLVAEARGVIESRPDGSEFSKHRIYSDGSFDSSDDEFDDEDDEG